MNDRHVAGLMGVHRNADNGRRADVGHEPAKVDPLHVCSMQLPDLLKRGIARRLRVFPLPPPPLRAEQTSPPTPPRSTPCTCVQCSFLIFSSAASLVGSGSFPSSRP